MVRLADEPDTPAAAAGWSGCGHARREDVCTNDCSGVAELADPAARGAEAHVMAMQAKHALTGVVAVAVVLTGCATTPMSGSGAPVSTTPSATGTVGPAPAVAESGRAIEGRAVNGFTGVEFRSIGELHIEQT